MYVAPQNQTFLNCLADFLHATNKFYKNKRKNYIAREKKEKMKIKIE